ncbi:MAG: cupin domain-containing protein [Acidimicrobiales bacterium]|nr:cupin domain-containing protein [Acidimicrobiales bacterium]
MNRFHFTVADGEHWGWADIAGVSLSTKDDCAAISGAVITVTGRHGETSSPINDRVYFVLTGIGRFAVAGEEVAVSPDEMVIVPKNTLYDFWSDSEMRLFVVDSPAFDEETESTS